MRLLFYYFSHLILLRYWRKEPDPLGSISRGAVFSPSAFCLVAGSSRGELTVLWCVPRFDRATISTFTSYFFLYPFLRNAGEPQWLRGPTGRPLEPDAGNAAEGSEGPVPDWRFQSCDFRAWIFVVRNRINQDRRK